MCITKQMIRGDFRLLIVTKVVVLFIAVLISRQSLVKFLIKGKMNMNKMTNENYLVQELPELRLWILALLAKAKKASLINTMLEIDVTRPLSLIQKYEAETGKKISFNAFLLKCIAKVVEENPQLNSYRYGWRKTITFKEVDVASIIEFDVAGKKNPAVYVVRSAERKTIFEIQDEIFQAKKFSPDSELSRDKSMNLIKCLPGWLQRLIWRIAIKDPRIRKKLEGTVVMSNLIKVTKEVAVISFSPCAATTSFIFCGIRKKPWVVNDQVVPRDILHLSCSIDHAVVDGGPIGRAGLRFVELVESGFELPQ